MNRRIFGKLCAAICFGLGIPSAEAQAFAVHEPRNSGLTVDNISREDLVKYFMEKYSIC